MFNGSTLDYVLHDEGVVELGSSSTASYSYYLKDHLGNVRMVVDAGGYAEQQNDYYPFGMEFASGGVSSNKYKYNGKEAQDDLIGGKKLGWLDYGARMYDPSIGRFTTQDPLSEDYYNLSSYGYCAGSPIACRDENGEWINFVVGAVVGGAMDYGIQVGTNYIDGKTGSDAWSDVDYTSIGVSTLTGAVGVGIASGVAKLTKVARIAKIASKSKTASKIVEGTANVTSDVTASIVGSRIQGTDVTLTSVISDVVGGKAGRKIGSSITNKAQPKQKLLNQQAKRTKRMARNTDKKSRLNKALKTNKKASNYETITKVKASAAGAVGSNATSKTIKIINTKTNEYQDN